MCVCWGWGLCGQHWIPERWSHRYPQKTVSASVTWPFHQRHPFPLELPLPLLSHSVDWTSMCVLRLCFLYAFAFLSVWGWTTREVPQNKGTIWSYLYQWSQLNRETVTSSSFFKMHSQKQRFRSGPLVCSNSICGPPFLHGQYMRKWGKERCFGLKSLQGPSRSKLHPWWRKCGIRGGQALVHSSDLYF